MQWGFRIVDPIFESKDDYEAMYLLAKKLGFADEMFKYIKVDGTKPLADDILREINRGSLSTGYTGQSPERLKDHMNHQGDFDKITMQATQGPLKGEYYGLPWPCWGTPEMKHPGTPILYDLNKSVAEGGLPFRANWGVEHNGVSLLAADGSTNKDSKSTNKDSKLIT